MNRRTKINLVWFGLVSVVFIVWAIRNILPIDAVNRPYEIKADFASSLGMQNGNEVAYLGTHYGSVSTVKRIPGGVRVTMKIDREKHIPAGSTAHLFRKSAIGEQYVDFAPPAGYTGPGGPWIRQDELIPRSRTTTPIEFSELLRSASRLISKVEPQDVDTVVHELAIGLNGQTDSLRALTQAGDDLGKTLAARTEALDRLATNNTRLTHVVTEHRGSLGNSLTDLRQLADTLKNSKGDVSLLLDRGNRLLSQVADVVAHNKGNLDCSLKDLEHVIDATTTPDKLAGLQTVLQQGPTGFGNLWKARDVEKDGSVWVRVGLIANPANPAPQYVPPNKLPAPKAIPACQSSLKPVAGDYVPLDARPAAAITPTPSNVALALFLALVAAGAVARETARLRSRA